MAQTRWQGARAESGTPRADERTTSGHRPKFEPVDALDRFAIPLPAEELLRVSEATREEEADPLLAYAEREGQLLARLAEREREITQLKERLEHAERALGEMLAKIAMTAIHESPTSPPPPPLPDENET